MITDGTAVARESTLDVARIRQDFPVIWEDAPVKFEAGTPAFVIGVLVRYPYLISTATLSIAFIK
jgi:hypothetical protein